MTRRASSITGRPPPADLIERIDDRVAKAEGVLLILILLVMVGLSAVQLVLRKFFDFGFEWADITVRQMVLWFGFVGGALATHQGRHIAIDAANKFIGPRRAAYVRSVTSAVSVVVMVLLVYASWEFLKGEIEAEVTVFGDFPSWPFQAIIPVAFVAITFHFLVGVRRYALVALGRRAPDPEEGEEPEEEGPQ